MNFEIKMSKDNILLHTNISIFMIKKLDNFFSRQTIQVKNDIFSEKRNEFFRLKNENPSADFSVLELSAFYNAIQIFYNLHEKAKKKNKTMSTSEIKKYGNFLIKSSTSLKKISKKENFLLDKSSMICGLIFENKSYREISLFIKDQYKTSISHTYIRQVAEKYPSIFKKNEEK
jgi:L-fucose mutarotase/ribose pyranase (RbsD/FucU family)